MESHERSVQLYLSGADVGRTDPWDHSMSPSTVANWMEPAEEHASEVRKLSTLLEASQALSATLDLEAGLQRVLEILGRHHGAVRSTVVLLNEQSGDVEVQASAGAIPRGKQVRYALGEGITGQVVADREADRRAARQPRAEVPEPRGRPARAREAGAELHLRADYARGPDGRRRRDRPASSNRTATTTGP